MESQQLKRTSFRKGIKFVLPNMFFHDGLFIVEISDFTLLFFASLLAI
uniref:Signal peptidase I n=1 Tax=Ascaris lumbricoides TaxID=6252 RepID=A0A0M3IRA3_ASCLU